MGDGRGFLSPEEHLQEYAELFRLLQENGEGNAGQAVEKTALLEERERNTDVFIPAVYLRKCCRLTKAEYWMVMFLFCCELEDGLCADYRNRYGGWPGLQYAVRMLSQVISVDFSLIAKIYEREGALRDILDAALEESGQRGILQAPLHLSPMAFGFLLTGSLPWEEWYRIYFAGEEEDMSKALLPLHEKECGMLCRYLNEEEDVRVLVHGGPGSGSHTLLRRACQKIGASVLLVETGRVFGASEILTDRTRQSLRLIVRLVRPVVVLEPVDDLPDTAERREWDRRIELLLDDLYGVRLCFLTRTQAQRELIRKYADVGIALGDTLSGEEKRMALETWLAPEYRRPWQEELLGRYRLTIGEFQKYKREIILRAGPDFPADREIWRAGLKETQEASRYGRVIEDGYGPEEMVLSKDCQRQLNTVIRLAKAWGGGKGFQVLFHGESGTGKTMAASVLAGQLGLPLFSVDLSRIFDKYIGETEKHIEEVFRVAERNRYLLFFDEADAVFTKRTAVKDSHDRYANVSAAYLLQRMEEYEGILILATNLKDHFDDAFVRRIRFVVKFRGLDGEGRERLWRKALKGNLPVGKDVDYKALAEAAALSPARICAAASVAKLLAVCDENGIIAKSHVREALEMEAGKDETVIKGF